MPIGVPLAIDYTPAVLSLKAMLLWAPAGYWIYHLFLRAVVADVGGVEAAVGIGAAIGLAAFGTFHPEGWVTASSSIALWLSAIGAPLADHLVNKHAHKTLDIERMKKACKALVSNPNNPSALADLGRSCHRANLNASAAIFLERAVAAAPQYMNDEKRMLQWVRRSVEGDPHDHPNSCPNCRYANDPGDILCKRCGGMVLVLLAGGRWLPESAPGKLLRIWAVALAVIFLAPMVGATMRSALAIPIIALVTIGGALLVWRIITR